MALIKDEKVYRNLQEQVYENTCDIQELLRMYGYHGPYTSTNEIPNDDLYDRAMYLIGTGMPYKVYQYSDITKRFTYIGDYNMDVGPEGPPGPQGPQGERGPDGKPASEIVNIETYDVVYRPDVTESKVRANFDDGHSNEFTVFAKNGESDVSNLIAGKGINVTHDSENDIVVIGVDDTIVDTNKLNEELSKKQDKLTPGEHISIVDNVISAIGVSGNVLSGNGITVENTADDKVIVNISNDVINQINDLETNKQDVIEDLDTIRYGASKGATAVQPAELNNYVTTNTTQVITGRKTFHPIEYDYDMSFNANGITFHRESGTETSNEVSILGNSGLFLYGNYGNSDYDENSILYRPNSATKKYYIGIIDYNGGGNISYYNFVQGKSGNVAITSEIPTKTSELTNDSDFITSSSLTGLATETYVNNAANNAVNSLDQTLAQVAKTGSYSDLSDKPDLTVYELKSEAFKGDYNDLTNKPDLSVYELKSEAFSGDYNDLTNKPTIPVVDYPVTSVNSKTGDVVLVAADINAKDNNTIQANIDRIDSNVSAAQTNIANIKSEITIVENKIPTQYLKSATVSDNTLHIVKSDGSSLDFTPSGGGGSDKQSAYIQCEYKNSQLIFTCNNYHGEQFYPISAKIYINANSAVSWDVENTKTIDLDMTAKGWNVKVTSNVIPPGGTIYSAYIVNPTVMDNIVTSTDLTDYATTDSLNAAVSDINNNKLDKPTNASSENYIKLMAVNYTGANKPVQASVNRGANCLVIRDSNSQINVPDTPTEIYHAASKKYVDDTVTASIPDTSKFVTLDTEQTISGHKFFTEGSIDIAQKGNTTGAIRLYGSGGIGIYDNGAGSTRVAYLTMPRTSGTLALTSDIPDTSNLVTLDTEQTITGVKSFANNTDFFGPIHIYGGDNRNKFIGIGDSYFRLYENYATDSGVVYESQLPKANGTLALTSDIPTDYVDLSTAQTIGGKKTFTGGVTAANFTAQGTNESTIYGGTQMVHTFSDNTKLNLQYPKKSGNQTIATVDDIPNVSNMVTTDTEQTITAAKTIQGNLSIKRANDTTALRIYNNQADNISLAG